MKELKAKLPGMTILSLMICLVITPESVGQDLKNSMIWKISGKDLEKPSYLFGTVHILDSSLFFLHETVIDKLHKVEALVFEINTNEEGYEQEAMSYSFMQDDSLTNILSASEYAYVDSFLMAEFKIPLKAVNKMKPFYIPSLINALSMPEKTRSYEAELQKIAIEEGIPISGITTMKEESKVLNTMSMRVQKHSLFEGIKEHIKDYPNRDKVISLYRKNNLNGLYKQMRSNSSPLDDQIYDIMFPRRHDVWLPNMMELMKEKSCFFAVGAGHLPGEEGLITRLRNEGYKVKPVNLDFRMF